MLIGEKYKIEADALNITLYQLEKNKKSGEPRWRAIAYFSSFQNALDHMADLEVSETGLKDFRAVSQKQQEIYDLIRTLQTTPEMLQGVRKPSKGKPGIKVGTG